MFKVLSCAAFVCVFGGLQGQPVYLEITNQSANPVEVMLSENVDDDIEIDVKKSGTDLRTMSFPGGLNSSSNLGSAKYLETIEPAGGNLLMTLDLTGTNVREGDTTEVLTLLNKAGRTVGHIGLRCIAKYTNNTATYDLSSNGLTREYRRQIYSGAPDPIFIVEAD